MFNKKSLFIFLLIFLLPLAVEAKTSKIAPPYPEVWGYDFSNFPSLRSRGTSISAFEMKDGDIWFLVYHSCEIKREGSFKTKNINKKYLLLKFFQNKKIWLSEKELQAWYKKLPEQSKGTTLSLGDKLVFSDGSTLCADRDFFALKRFCPDFYYSYLVKTDKNNQQEKYTILTISPMTDLRIDGGPGEDTPSGPFFYPRVEAFAWFVPLKDDTFIVYSEGSGLILRFDKDLNTRFMPVNSVKIKNNIINRNFFVLPFSFIEQLQSNHSNKVAFEFQSIQDALLNHFSNVSK